MRTWILFFSSLLIVAGPGCGSDDETTKEVLEGYGAKLSESDINATMAVYPGVIHTRTGNRKPPTAAYGGESPVLYYDEDEGVWVGGELIYLQGGATLTYVRENSTE